MKLRRRLRAAWTAFRSPQLVEDGQELAHAMRALEYDHFALIAPDEVTGFSMRILSYHQQRAIYDYLNRKHEAVDVSVERDAKGNRVTTILPGHGWE